MALGIPIFSLPVNDASELLPENHLVWVREQTEKEQLREQQSQNLIEHKSLALGPDEFNDLVQITSDHYFGMQHARSIG